MLESLEPVAHEALTRDLGCSFPTVLGTAAHIAAAEWVWLSRWKGTNPREMPEWAKSPDFAEIKATFAALEAERSAWLATLAESALGQPLAFRLFNGTEDARPLSVQFQHVVNHGTYHRGQVAVMLRQVGTMPNPTDIIRWARERA
jgi:uncharacterized damage-inducible protein DinB